MAKSKGKTFNFGTRDWGSHSVSNQQVMLAFFKSQYVQDLLELAAPSGGINVCSSHLSFSVFSVKRQRPV